MALVNDPDWIEDCLKWHGTLLTGRRSHWCLEWDLLPVDETCPEYPCGCPSVWWDHPLQEI